jgi:NADPH:quinone reductase-like Zn-dependent oxidoreductase
MRAAGIDVFGGAVGVMTLPEPRPLGSDEVLLEVRAAGVGNWDEFVRVGAWDVGVSPPMALGVGASGVIVALGDRVSQWSVGDAALTHPVPLRDQGAWSEQLIAAGDLLAAKPADVSWEQAAAFPVPALTAEQALGEVIVLGGGDWLLVHGAGGVTGGFLVALARLRGVRVIATASPRRSERLAALGVEAVLDYHDERWPQQVRALTQGVGVTAAVNAARGGERETLSTVADGGRLATITGAPPSPEREVTIANIYVRADGERLQQLARPLADRAIPVAIGAVYELARAAEALTLATHGGADGAIVLTP